MQWNALWAAAVISPVFQIGDTGTHSHTDKPMKHQDEAVN